MCPITGLMREQVVVAHRPAPVLDLGEDFQPVLGTLTPVAGPQSEDVAFSVDRDG